MFQPITSCFHCRGRLNLPFHRAPFHPNGTSSAVRLVVHLPGHVVRHPGRDQVEIFHACPPMRGTHALSFSWMSRWIGSIPLGIRSTESPDVSPTPTVTPSPPPNLIRNEHPVDFDCHVILLTRTGTRHRGRNPRCEGRLLQRITASSREGEKKKRADPLR